MRKKLGRFNSFINSQKRITQNKNSKNIPRKSFFLPFKDVGSNRQKKELISKIKLEAAL